VSNLPHRMFPLLDPGPDGRGPENRFEEYAYAWWNGWRWARSDIRFRRSVACVLCTLYWAYVRGYMLETCGFCGRPVLVVDQFEVTGMNKLMRGRFSGEPGYLSNVDDAAHQKELNGGGGEPIEDNTAYSVVTSLEPEVSGSGISEDAAVEHAINEMLSVDPNGLALTEGCFFDDFENWRGHVVYRPS
jgi:hypothetical protein